MTVTHESEPPVATGVTVDELQVDSTLEVLLEESAEAARRFLALCRKLESQAPGSEEHADTLIDLSVVLLDLSIDAEHTQDYIGELIDRLPIDPADELTADEDLGPDYESPIFMSLAEAARASGLAPTTLRNQIHKGRLKAVKVARNWIVTRESVETYLASRRVNAKPVQMKPRPRRRRSKQRPSGPVPR